MKLTLKTRIYKYLTLKIDWTHKGEIARKGEEAGYLGETVGRRLRELEESGAIIRKLNEKGQAMYKVANTETKPQGKWIFEDNVAKFVQI